MNGKKNMFCSPECMGVFTEGITASIRASGVLNSSQVDLFGRLGILHCVWVVLMVLEGSLSLSWIQFKQPQVFLISLNAKMDHMSSQCLYACPKYFKSWVSGVDFVQNIRRSCFPCKSMESYYGNLICFVEYMLSVSDSIYCTCIKYWTFHCSLGNSLPTGLSFCQMSWISGI